MKSVTTCLLLLVALTATSAAQAPQFPPPGEEHAWLKQFEGKWTAKSKTIESPQMPMMESTGTMTARMLGGFWIVCEIENKMAGTLCQAMQTIGYDRKSEKYVGTWVDSVMGHLWTYEGTVDQDGKRLTLIAQGPNFIGEGDNLLYRDRYEFKSPDVIATISETKTGDGEWVPFMKGEMQRVADEANE